MQPMIETHKIRLDVENKSIAVARKEFLQIAEQYPNAEMPNSVKIRVMNLSKKILKAKTAMVNAQIELLLLNELIPSAEDLDYIEQYIKARLAELALQAALTELDEEEQRKLRKVLEEIIPEVRREREIILNKCSSYLEIVYQGFFDPELTAAARTILYQFFITVTEIASDLRQGNFREVFEKSFAVVEFCYNLYRNIVGTDLSADTEPPVSAYNESGNTAAVMDAGESAENARKMDNVKEILKIHLQVQQLNKEYEDLQPLSAFGLDAYDSEYSDKKLSLATDITRLQTEKKQLVEDVEVLEGLSSGARPSSYTQLLRLVDRAVKGCEATTAQATELTEHLMAVCNLIDDNADPTVIASEIDFLQSLIDSVNYSTAIYNAKAMALEYLLDDEMAKTPKAEASGKITKAKRVYGEYQDAMLGLTMQVEYVKNRLDTLDESLAEPKKTVTWQQKASSAIKKSAAELSEREQHANAKINKGHSAGPS